MEELSYMVAYVVLPHYAFKDREKVVGMWKAGPNLPGAFLYLMACKMKEIEPVEEDVTRFKAEVHQIDGVDYYVLQHPEPTPVDMSNLEAEEVLNSPGGFVLAPYLSCMVHDTASGAVSLYILGQAPIGGGTTLRTVTANGMNANLGPGPQPNVENLLSAITSRRS